MRYSITIFFIVSLLFVCRPCFAQLDKIDSLKKVLPTLQDTARIDCLGEIAVYYVLENSGKDSSDYYIGEEYKESKKINYLHGIAAVYLQKAAFANHFYNDYFQMEKMANEAITWFNKTDNKKDIQIAYWQLCCSKCKQSKYKEAETNGKLCYQWAKKIDKDWQANALEILTDVYRETGDYDKLFAIQQEIIARERKVDDTSEYTFHELWVIGLMYRLLEEYSTALPMWQRLFYPAGIAPKKFIEAWGAWNLTDYADLLALANKPDSALYYYDQFDSANAEPKDLRYFLISKGEYYLVLKQYNTALPYFLKGLSYHRQVGDVTQAKRALLDIAKTYEALQNNDSAVIFAWQELAIALPSNSKPYLRDGYKILSTIYDRLGRIDSANLYFRKYISARDAVFSDQTKGRFLAYNYQQKLTTLNKQKILQQEQLQKEKLNRNILIGILAFGLVLAGFVIRNVQLKRRKDQLQHLMTEANTQLETRRKEQQLMEMQQKKTELEMQALRAQMNPHFIFNSLNSINMFILENNKLQASEYLSKFSKLVRLILQNSQEAFIPLEKELEALQLYLELESLRFDNKFEYKISIDGNVDTTILQVPPLIIQPYAENAIWHGLMHKREKGHLQIVLYMEKEMLFCNITDDGVGRESAAALKSKSASLNKSMGMRITADRIAILQQKNQDNYIKITDLVLPDGSAGGTEVIIKMPVYYE